jgi:hypothetical protein
MKPDDKPDDGSVPADAAYYAALTALAARYFAVWPEDREALLEAHRAEGEALTAKIGTSMQEVATHLRGVAAEDIQRVLLSGLIGARGDTETAIRGMAWVLTEDPRTGGVLGSALTLGSVPIFTPSEVLEFVEAPDDVLREHPPVVLDRGEVVGGVRTAPLPRDFDLAGWIESQPLAALTLRGLRISRDELPEGEIRDRFDALAAQFSKKEDVREAYHAFARAFWALGAASAADGAATHRSSPRGLVPFFRGRDVVETLSDPIAFGTHRALSSPSKWNQEPGEIAYFDDAGFSGLRFSIGGFVGEDSPTGLTVIDNEAWLNPSTSIIHEAVIAKWLHAYRSGTLEESLAVRIRVDEILDLRGEKKHHKGGFPRKAKVDVSRRLLRLDKLFVRGVYLDPTGKKHAVKGRPINVTVDSEVDLFGDETPYEFLVRPGDATFPFYANSTYLADYFTALAKLDVRRPGVQRMAYLIGRYLIHQWRIREVHGNFDQPFRVETILEGARIEKEANANHYSRFREYFDAALDLLATIGIIRSWQYVPGDEESLPAQRWFAEWIRRCRVVIVPPTSVVEHAALRSTAQTQAVKAIAGKKSRR